MTVSPAAVVVVGPPLAGVSSIVGALRGHLPGAWVLEAKELQQARAPTAVVVVAVVSAVAPMTESDWALIEPAGPAIAVVAKIDAHRRWRAVMAANRDLVADWAPHRATMPWVGVAAAPELGAPDVGGLVDPLRTLLAGPDARRRRLPRDPSPQRPAATSRPSPGAGPAEVRRVLQRARLHLLRIVRDRCASMRTECRDAATAVSHGGSDRFDSLVRDRAGRVLADVDVEIDLAVAAAATELGLALPRPVLRPEPPEIPRVPSASRHTEARLTAVLGVGFGLGVALASSRLLAGLAPALPLLALAVGGVAGLALATWVVRVRRLLHDRALLERWATEATAALRWHGEATVAERLLAAETDWVAARVSHPPSGGSQRASPAHETGAKKLLSSTNGDPPRNRRRNLPEPYL